MNNRLLILWVLLISFIACSDDKEESSITEFRLESVSIDGIRDQNSYTDVSVDPVILLTFSEEVGSSSVSDNIRILNQSGQIIPINYTFENNKTLTIEPKEKLASWMTYTLSILPNLTSTSGTKIFTGKNYTFTTGLDLSDKFPRISDNELLDLVQKQTFRYFWDYGHPTSGMARERTGSGNTVTTGGTGFGIMSMIVAAERNFITRNEALQRIQTIVSFLETRCTSYHGAYAHWVNGQTGETIAFSENDNGADLVETALLFQGLLTARSYFTEATTEEIKLRETITGLWEAIEWNWFRKENENVLYWHWSQNSQWGMNLPIRGWNESLIVYILAASSPTDPIPTEVYHEGWAQNGAIRNGNTYYGQTLPLGEAYGGPLFFSHYSFLGINPEGLSDSYTNYWNQNRSHSLINYNYCVSNPKGYRGYTEDCWGLTASDGNNGYSAHSPTNDQGVIAPTAAISSMPYTPEESMKALHFFYYKLGDKLWSEYGFYDAFNLSARWFDNQYIAIDQGPVILMIENYRSGLLWDLLMADPEIKKGLIRLGFQSDKI